MKFKIVWSDLAECQMDDIFEYYKVRASESVARKLVKELINAPKILVSAPLIGQVEELLLDRRISYRYLIHKNYKIIYSVDQENFLIKIADIFDTRQNPLMIERGK